MGKDCENGIDISNLAITDFSFSAEFNQAIENKIKAEQGALKAENEKLQIITETEAEAAQVQLNADALSYKIITESNATAQAIVMEANALRDNPALIKLRTANKWNGQYPRFMGANNMVPMFNFNHNQR